MCVCVCVCVCVCACVYLMFKNSMVLAINQQAQKNIKIYLRKRDCFFKGTYTEQASSEV